MSEHLCGLSVAVSLLVGFLYLVFDIVFLAPRLRRRVLQYLADRPHEWVSTIQLRDVFGFGVYYAIGQEESLGRIERRIEPSRFNENIGRHYVRVLPPWRDGAPS